MTVFLNKLKEFKRILISYVLTNRLFLSYVLLSIIGSTIVKFATLGKFGSFLSFITDLGIIIIIGSLGYFFKGKKQFRYYFTWIFIYSTVEMCNAIYYLFYTSFGSFGELESLSQTETVTGSIFEKLNVSYLIFIIIPLLLYVAHKKLLNSSYYNLLEKVESSKKMFFTTLILGTFLIVFSFSNATKNDYSRLAKQWNRIYIVERFGILMYQGNDLVQTLRPKFSSLFGEEDALKAFDEYYSAESYDNYRTDNKYTDILKGYNVVFVHMEGIQDYVMNLEFNGGVLTPNLNNLASEGMFFENFYPEVSSGTSSDTEFSLLTSLMPASSGTVFVSYYNRVYNAIPKILSNDGYYTFSMHGNLSSMWNRNKVHPLLGYQGMYFRESFEYDEETEKINLGINDKLFFKEAIPILETIETENNKYMGTIITLSNHSPFTFLDKYGEFDLSRNYSYVDEEGNSVTGSSSYLEGTSVGNYLHSVHYADQALGDFINYIKESDYFNNTVFVFYGDHDAKLSRSEMNILYNYNYETEKVYTPEDENYTSYDSFDHELNKKTPLIIWTKNKTLSKTFSGTVDYYMGMIDVEPTILNMLGYKNEYALGHDIFSIKEDNVIPFPNGNFLTNLVYYNNSTSEYKIISNNSVIDENYIEKNKKYVEDLLEVSNSIIVYDLLNEDRNEE